MRFGFLNHHQRHSKQGASSVQGQRDQNRPPLTWKKLTVQVKWGTKTYGCLDRKQDREQECLLPCECGPQVRAHRGVPPLKRHMGSLGWVGVCVCVSGVCRVLLLLLVGCAGPSPSILGGRWPGNTWGFTLLMERQAHPAALRYRPLTSPQAHGLTAHKLTASQAQVGFPRLCNLCDKR